MDIYYARVYGYQTKKAGGSVGFYWPIAEPSFQEGISLKDAGSWQLYSGRTDRTSFPSGSYQFRLDYNNNYIAGTMYFSAPMLIDLTAAFGSGNEPTKEWMDSNIPYFAGSYVKLRTGDILNYAYTGAVQSVSLPKGVYKLEVWGAQGGSYSSYYGGAGGYSVGVLTLTADTTKLFVYVGGQPTTSTSSSVTIAGGFNGGGKARYHSYNNTTTYCQAGGGGSDIRIGTDSLYARVIVAGGGGGSASVNAKTTKYGGGTSGGSPQSGYAASQTSAGTNGSFGVGADGYISGYNYKYASGGGGGGWYGGGAINKHSDSTNYRGYNGGGSGFVWTGSNAPSGYLLGPEYYLADASTIAGNASMPNTSGGTETGHTGNGYARITAISIESFNGYVKVASGWKQISELFVKANIDGTPTWKKANSIHVRDSSAWKNT